MLVDIYKNKNVTSRAYGLYYPRIFFRDGLNLKGFAKHISEHGSLVTYELAVLVLQNIVNCLREMMTQGVPVKLDGLGTFSPGIQSAHGVANLEDFNAEEHIKAVKINFRPEGAGAEEDKLTGKALKAQTTFQMNDYVEVFYKMVGGKEVTYQKRTPLKSYANSIAPEDPDDPDGD
jgi:predicted histone-like DNA-binding protein